MRLVLLVVAVVSVACSSSLMAQDVAYGAKAGVNFATVNFEEELRVEIERRVGVAAGGFVWLPIRGRLGLQPEVLFGQKGVVLKSPASPVADIIAALNYLEVPLLATYRMSGSANRGVYGLAGPSIAFKLSAKTVIRSDDAKEEEDNDEIKNVDVGVVVGAGMKFDRLVIEARYTFGLTDVRGAEFEDKAQNRVITLLAGVRF